MGQVTITITDAKGGGSDIEFAFSEPVDLQHYDGDSEAIDVGRLIVAYVASLDAEGFRNTLAGYDTDPTKAN